MITNNQETMSTSFESHFIFSGIDKHKAGKGKAV